MLRTIVWFSYFWLYLIKIMPKYFKANQFLKDGKIKERDILVNSVASKWAKDLLKVAGASVKDRKSVV